jgi:large subunit ribosomal protein L1
MDKKDLIKALKSVKENSPKRKFKQSYDLIINLRNLDLKKTDNHIDSFIQLHHERGKKVKICALVGPELKETATKNCDTVILLDDFNKYTKDKTLTKKLAEDNDFFIAQATIMPKVAAAFGRVLGPKGRMPNPKAGCVVPPNANLEPLAKKLHNTVRMRINASPLFQCRVGNEETEEESIVANAMDIYNSLIHILPGAQNNIRSIYVKLTMGPSVKVGGTEVVEEPGKKEKPVKKEEKAEEKAPKEKTPKSEEPKKEEKAPKEKAKEEPKKEE